MAGSLTWAIIAKISLRAVQKVTFSAVFEMGDFMAGGA
jgi:hypothetical protein